MARLSKRRFGIDLRARLWCHSRDPPVPRGSRHHDHAMTVDSYRPPSDRGGHPSHPGVAGVAPETLTGPAATAHALRPDALGTHHAVAAGHPLAALAAHRVLEGGGNAVDAGVAAGICL